MYDAFGPITWDIMLLCALAYPINPTEDEQRNMLDFLYGLMNVLPCSGCSVHAVTYLYKHIPDVSSSASLVTYIVNFHNVVNTFAGKRVYTNKEAVESIVKRYLTNDTDMDHMQSMRIEDHAKIVKLQKKLDDRYSYIDYFIFTNNIVITILLIIGISIYIWKTSLFKHRSHQTSKKNSVLGL